jgi:hypothetical protein
MDNQLLNNMMTGQTGKVSTGMNNLGLPPIGNRTGVQTPSVGAVPGASATIPGQSPISPVLQGVRPNPLTSGTLLTPNGGVPGGQTTLGSGNTGSGAPVGSSGGTISIGTGGSNTVSVDTTSGPFAGMNEGQINETLKQLRDTYGNGIGTLLFSTMANLGGQNDQYMQAYEKAMAGPNAENLATLNTTLGNSGVSANSSTAAIANADFQSNVTAQEGLQEAQLQKQDATLSASILEGILPTEAKQTSDANQSVFGQIINDIGGIESIIPGLDIAAGKAFSSVPGFGSGGDSPFNANQGGPQSGAADTYLAGML